MIKAEPPTYDRLRLTIPVREALERAGNYVSRLGAMNAAGYETYTITLTGTVPPGLVIALIGQHDEQHRGLRLATEPAYPGEWPAKAVSWRDVGDWLPCPHPRCGRALVWYEAGYVPGYRLCTRGHHSQVSGDGRTVACVKRK